MSMNWISRLLRPSKGPILPVSNLVLNYAFRTRAAPSGAISWRTSVLFSTPKIYSRTDSLLSGFGTPQLAMVRSLCTPKEDPPVMKRPAAKENKWITHLKSHREEFINLLLASVLLIVTLRMLREKGEKLDEKKSLEKSVEDLKEELSNIKQGMHQFVESDLPKLITQLKEAKGLKNSKVESLSRQIKKKINLILFREPSPTAIVSGTKQAPPDDSAGMQNTIGKGLM